MKNIPLYQKIFEHYYEKIMNGQLKEGQQIHTDKEIMDIFFVSRITAKAAIEMLVERGLVQRIPGKGSFVTKTPVVHSRTQSPSKLIGVILCDIDHSFGFDILKGIEEEASRRNIHIIFKRTFESSKVENDVIQSMVQLGVNGIIIQMVHGETYSNEILKYYLNGLPMVLIDRHMDKTRVPFVTTDNKVSAAKMVTYLLENGYKNISFFSASTSGTSTLNFRYEGIKSVYTAPKNIDLLTLKTPEIRERDKQTIEGDYQMIKDHLMKFPEIDCIFAAEHYVAKLVKKVLDDIGKRIPEDMGVVCFDSDASDFDEPFFTHVNQRQYDMGKKAIEKMDDINEGSFKYPFDCYIEGDIIKGKSIKYKNNGE